tara:strand:+ start:338 stop:817 length:480 start_codon:yes stop_codon:yes gene_type:complete
LKKINFILLLICIAIVSRIVPHPPNFTPITAIALFSSIHFKNKLYKYFIPITGLIISDIIIGISLINIFVYLSFILISFIGAKFQKINNYSIMLSSTSFFVISNFGVWLIGYPKNIEGFILCYYMALPFFINTILGDLFYCYAMKYSLVYAINKKIILR